jgi:hypothetical protein
MIAARAAKLAKLTAPRQLIERIGGLNKEVVSAQPPS